MRYKIDIRTGRICPRTVTLALLFNACCLVGCGIPKLRSALPGAAMPASFLAGSNWSQGQTGNIYTAPSAPPNNSPMPPADTTAPTDGQRKSPEASADGGQDQQTPGEVAPSTDQSEQTQDKSTSRKWYSAATKLVSYVKPSSAIKLDGDKNDDKKDTQTDSQSAAVDPIADPAKVGAAEGNQIGGQGTTNPWGTAPNPILLSGGGWHADPTGSPSSAMVGKFELFNDPMLAGLIEQGISGNQELKILAEEVQIACNEVQSRSGAYRPFVGAAARVGVDKSGRYTREGAVEDQLEGRPGRSFPDPVPDFLVGTTVSWEIDIWKRLRNAQRAAAMRYLGTQDGRNYVVTRLVSEIAENYYELLALDNRLVALNQIISLQQKSLEVAQAKKAAARETELAVQRFQAEVRKNESERLIVQQQIIEAENRINSLLGRYPQPIARPSVDLITIQFNTLSTGVPPELLRNRADIRQAERDVAAAGLDIQVAKARFYPALGLSAGVGYRAFDARYLFQTPDSLIYNVAGDLVGPLINKRAIQADYRTANARQLQSVYNYQQTIIDAFTEVVNYLAKAENYGQSIEVKKQQLAALEQSVDVATKLFQNARAEYMEVLLAQRDMMEARMTLIETKQEQLSAMVNAYRALGGGAF